MYTRRVRNLHLEEQLALKKRRQIALKRLEGMRKVHAFLKKEDAKKQAGQCCHCNRTGLPLSQSSIGPSYVYNGRGVNPNRSYLLCEECNKEHDDYWQEMWSNYYSSVM